DAAALSVIKIAVDPEGRVLESWDSSFDPCNGSESWFGVSCLRGRVAGIVLENLKLRGGFPVSVVGLSQLRVLSLKGNGFSGSVPDLSPLVHLRFLFISHNNFSGEFPASLTSLSKLYRLDLSWNNFSGGISRGVNRLSHLLTLRLEGNRFTGPLPFLRLPNLQDFNASGNGLTGEIPASLSRFPASSFLNNANLCGSPLQLQCPAISSNSAKSGAGGAIATPTVASSPTAFPAAKQRNTQKPKITSLDIILITIGDLLVLGLISLLLYWYFRRNHPRNKPAKSDKTAAPQSNLTPSSPYPFPPQSGSDQRTRIVFFDEYDKKFELEDLLRASAEMLGKGGFGTTYKAMLDDGGGSVVAVKRLKDLCGVSKKEFEQQMEILGKLKHPNLVPLKAYYFAGDEKLLVLDLMPNGSLFWLLHGNRGPGRTPLDWRSRFRIATGAARGLAFIHHRHSCKKPPPRLVHGNIKSTNVLIDADGNAKLSDFGLFALAASSVNNSSNGYRAPESVLDARKLTQKSDVYSFGVLLLEILTGKSPVDADLPRWVQSVVREEWTAEVFDLELMRYKDFEEEMVGLLQIAMVCTQISPDRRPKMSGVVKMMQELKGTEDSQSHETTDYSLSDS
ncbi:hypothetical protein M569_01705, partial [Genlisea aurea]